MKRMSQNAHRLQAESRYVQGKQNPPESKTE
jgi:hypothetical protein